MLSLSSLHRHPSAMQRSSAHLAVLSHRASFPETHIQGVRAHEGEPPHSRLFGAVRSRLGTLGAGVPRLLREGYFGTLETYFEPCKDCSGSHVGLFTHLADLNMNARKIGLNHHCDQRTRHASSVGFSFRAAAATLKIQQPLSLHLHAHVWFLLQVLGAASS